MVVLESGPLTTVQLAVYSLLPSKMDMPWIQEHWFVGSGTVAVVRHSIEYNVPSGWTVMTDASNAAPSIGSRSSVTTGRVDVLAWAAVPVASTATRHRPRRVCLAMIDPSYEKGARGFGFLWLSYDAGWLQNVLNFGGHVFVGFVQFPDITRHPNGTYRLLSKVVVSTAALSLTCRNVPKFSSQTLLTASSS
jgi:hypothetical protein